MSHKESLTFDVAIVGSGFSGNLTALCLHQSGMKVCVIEKNSHPRFAVGESSTPIADMILRSLSQKYDLPWLKDFSRYGSWQKNYPEVTCGLKRGFSYYKHQAGQPFRPQDDHGNELLVAASSSDEESDTNWLRSEFDAFLSEKLQDYGICYYDNTNIISLIQGKDDTWHFETDSNGTEREIRAGFFVDATGSPALLGKFLGIKSTGSNFKTHSRALYTHFTGLKPWNHYLEEAGHATSDYPYDPDYSALHHILDDGWLWMLRFNDNRVSAGILTNSRKKINENPSLSPAEEWQETISRYPALETVFDKARPASNPGKFFKTKRLQRRLSTFTGPGWAALPHTAGFVDPLHSTGIAHTLCGVEKLVDILSGYFKDGGSIDHELENYEQSISRELELIDYLVAGCYRSMNHFELFTTYAMLYFIAAIRYEQTRLKGEIPKYFMDADNTEIYEIVTKSYSELNRLVTGNITDLEVNRFRETIRQRITPYNTAGLLNEEARNMYRHTAVSLG